MAEHDSTSASLNVAPEMASKDSEGQKNVATGEDEKIAGGATGVAQAEPDFSSSDPEDTETPEGEVPTEREQRTLRRVGERPSFVVFLVAIIELCERFTYYGCNGIFQNYIQKPRNGSLGEGGLGLGHAGATGFTTFFQFWCYVTPLAGGIVADQYLGKYKTLLASSGIYMSGLLVLVCTSLPSSLAHGAGLGGYVTAIVLIGIGTGGIKANVAPLIAEQYTRRTQAIKTTKKGERVIIDPYVTVQHIYMMFYWSINIGALSMMATPFMERAKGYWTAYTMCLCMFIVGTTILVVGRKLYVDRPPSGTVVTDAFRTIGIMIRHRSMDAPKPSWQTERGMQVTNHWDDQFVDEVKRALTACKVFLIYPIFWLCYGQFSNNFVSQALQMSGHGIPNDFMQNFDALSIIVFVPILDRLVYPFLLKHNIRFKPISRITSGFIVMSFGMVWASVVQHYIYTRPPCYGHPLCAASEVDGQAQGNDIHIASQVGAYVFIGIAEILASATGYEYAYTKAPPRLKSFVQSLFLLTNAFGAALNEAFLPVLYDPAIMWMYAGIGISCFLSGCLVWVLFRHLNDQEDKLNYIEKDVTVSPESEPGEKQD